MFMLLGAPGPKFLVIYMLSGGAWAKILAIYMLWGMLFHHFWANAMEPLGSGCIQLGICENLVEMTG